MSLYSSTAWLDVLLLLGAIQGILLSMILLQKRQSTNGAVKYLSFILVMTSVVLFGRFLYSYQSSHPLIVFLFVYSDSIVLLFGPFIYFFVRLLLQMPLPRPKVRRWHYLPALLHLTVFNLPIFLTWLEVAPMVSRTQILWMYNGMELTAMLSLGIYFYWSMQLFTEYKEAFLTRFSLPQLPSFLRAVFICFSLLLAFWAIGFTLKVNKLVQDQNYLIYYAFWITSTLFVYLITYKILLNPQLLELPEVKSGSTQALASPLASAGEVTQLKSRVQTFMERQQPFLNPGLSLDDLAEALDLSRHELSRVINQGFNKNFFDFINAHRIEAFIQTFQARSPANPTFLEIAYEVGFNSKSAFNRAFRKEKGCAPSVFFKNQEVSSGN